MTGQAFVTIMQPLSRSEQAELFDLLPENAMTTRPTGLAPGNLGEAASAFIVLALTMTTLAALCTWVSTRGKNVKLGIKLSGLSLSSEVQVEITGDDTAEGIRERLRSKGIEVDK